MIKFSQIIADMSDIGQINVISESENLKIQDVALMDISLTEFNKGTLYFGYSNQLEMLDRYPAQCILADTGAMVHSSFPPFYNTEMNLALISSQIFFAAFNCAKRIVETNRSLGLYEELTSLADQSRSLDTVIDAAAIRLGSALVFSDLTFKIISSSTSVPVKDPAWVENIRQGYCNYEFISKVKTLKSLNNALQTDTAVEVFFPDSPFRKLSSKVFHNGIQTGFILMFEDENTFLPSHREMLTVVSQVLGYTISLYVPELSQGKSPYQQILYDMLIGAPLSEVIPRLRSMRFAELMNAVYIRPTGSLDHSYMEQTEKNLKKQFPGTHITYHKSGIAAIIPLENTVQISSKQLAHMKNFSQQEGVLIGISNAFSDIEHFADYFDQAYQAIEIGLNFSPKQTVFCYIDYQFFDLLSKTENPDRLGHFCHPALALLRKYDHENATQLYQTLLVYLEQGCSIKDTSDALYIHRNSLTYRLNRIEQICGIDLTHIDTQFLLRASFLIDQYNGMCSA